MTNLISTRRPAAHHLVEDLARIGLKSHCHLDLVTPALGVFPSGALESDVDTVGTSRVETVSAALGELVHPLRDVLMLVKVESLNLAAELLDGVVETPLNVVHGNDAGGALEKSPLRGELFSNGSAGGMQRSRADAAYESDSSHSPDADAVADRGQRR